MLSTIYLPIVKHSLPNEQAMFAFLRDHPNQQRTGMVWDSCLASIAHVRATQLAIEWSHCYQGNCVNRIVRSLCPLPKAYSENGNDIESAVGGEPDPVKAVISLLKSEAHSDHILGRLPRFKKQQRTGIGYVQVVGSAHQYYYSILISE